MISANRSGALRESTLATASDGMLPVSVIVPTFNRCARLARLLCSLNDASSQGVEFEVIVAVDGSSDDTGTMLSALHPSYPLQVLMQSNRGPAAARNRAIAVARGELLLFMDDDVVPGNRLIERHMEVHRQDPRAVVIGPMLPPPSTRMAPWLRWEAMALQKQYDAMRAGRYPPTPRQFYTGNASVRREHLLAAGGFDEQFRRAEDVELAFRLADRGLRFYFVADSPVLHEPDRTFESWLRVPYEYGRHDVIMARHRNRPSVLQDAYRHAKTRHPLSRLLAHWCVGHAWRVRAALSALRFMLRADAGLPDRFQMALCSAIWNVQYWQGIADATSLSACVWVQGRVLGEADTLAAGCTGPHDVQRARREPASLKSLE